jgi:hypothetical protein
VVKLGPRRISPGPRWPWYVVVLVFAIITLIAYALGAHWPGALVIALVIVADARMWAIRGLRRW